MQTSRRIAGKGIIAQPTKSAKGRRAIALDPDTVAVLRAHRAKQLENRLRLGEVCQDRGLVFCDVDGSPLNPDLLTRTFRRPADQNGLKGLRLHDLRRFHASTLLQAGIHPEIVQERLGHAAIAVNGHLQPLAAGSPRASRTRLRCQHEDGQEERPYKVMKTDDVVAIEVRLTTGAKRYFLTRDVFRMRLILNPLRS